MAPLTHDEYIRMAQLIATQLSDAAIVRQLRCDIRCVRSGRARLAETGTIFPDKGGVVAGEVYQERRKTTAAQDAQVRPVILANRGGPLEWTVVKTMATIEPPMELHRTNGNRRMNENNFFAYRPRRKESYSKPDRNKRVRVAKKMLAIGAKKVRGKTTKKQPRRTWSKCIFFDEHGVFHAPQGALADRQLHAGKRFCLREPGEDPFKGELVSQQKNAKSLKGGTRMHFAAAIFDGEAHTETADALISRSKPLPDPPPKLSVNGKPLGRKRKAKDPNKKRNYDGPAHAQFLAETARWALARMGFVPGGPRWSKRPRLLCHQDGDNLHWTDQCRAVFVKYRMDFIETDKRKMLTYSPDLNAIENCFKMADDALKKMSVERGPAKNQQETWDRFKEAMCGLRQADDGRNLILNCTEDFADRLRTVIEKKGIATRW